MRESCGAQGGAYAFLAKLKGEGASMMVIARSDDAVTQALSPRVASRGRGLAAAAMALLLCALSAACSYDGGVGDPAIRKLSWFDFLDGGDLKRGCKVGSRDQLRLVYNQDYRTHVRIYEIVADASGGAVLSARPVLGRPGPSFSLSTVGLDWESPATQTSLSPAQWQALMATLKADQALGPAPDGLRVHAFETFWTISGCIAGKPAFQVFKVDTPEFTRLSFPAALFGHDRSGVPVEAPRRLIDQSAADIKAAQTTIDGADPSFTLSTAPNGFAGLIRLF